MVKTNIQLIEGFEFEFPYNQKIVGLITENEEVLSFHFKPHTEIYKTLQKSKWQHP